MRRSSSTPFLPALISYIALFYIVHLEALMIDAKPFERATQRSSRERWIRRGLGWSGTIVVCCLIYFGINAIQRCSASGAPCCSL